MRRDGNGDGWVCAWDFSAEAKQEGDEKNMARAVCGAVRCDGLVSKRCTMHDARSTMQETVHLCRGRENKMGRVWT